MSKDSPWSEPDCRNWPIEVMVNRSHKGKFNGDWSKYNKQFNRIETTARGLAIEVYRGYSFCPVANGARSKANFSGAWHVALDFDSGDERSSLGYLTGEYWVGNFASFGYTTPSHTKEKPKGRIVWVLERSITDIEKYEQLTKALLWRFDWADKSTKDAARLFFGSPNCELWDNWQLLTAGAAHELVRLHKIAKKSATGPTARASNGARKLEPGGYAERLADDKLDVLCDKLKNAADGEKHKTLRDVARTLGGYVGGGYFSATEVEEKLTGTIDSMGNVEDKKLAYKTITDSISYGIRDPLYFRTEWRPTRGKA